MEKERLRSINKRIIAPFALSTIGAAMTVGSVYSDDSGPEYAHKVFVAGIARDAPIVAAVPGLARDPPETPTPRAEPLYIHPNPYDGPRPVGVVIPQDPEIWRKLLLTKEWDVDEAMSVMHCESKSDPWVVGNAGERGLFQIHPTFHQWRADLFGGDLFDPLVNVQTAYHIYQDSGWGPWTCKP